MNRHCLTWIAAGALALGCARDAQRAAEGLPAVESPTPGNPSGGTPGATGHTGWSGTTAGYPRHEVPEVALAGTPLPLTWIHVNGEPFLPPYEFTEWRSGWQEPQRLVLRTPAEWEAAWATTFGGWSGAPPAVDFTREVVILVAQGLRGMPDRRLYIRNAAVDDSGKVTVGLADVTVDPTGCAFAAICTEIVAMARMPRPRGEVAFVTSPILELCGTPQIPSALCRDLIERYDRLVASLRACTATPQCSIRRPQAYGDGMGPVAMAPLECPTWINGSDPAAVAQLDDLLAQYQAAGCYVAQGVCAGTLPTECTQAGTCRP